MRVLSRTWQMLLKGIAEVQDAGRPLAAAEMVLVRIAYAADLPTPDEVDPHADGDGGAAARASAGNGGRRRAAPQPCRAARVASRARGAARRCARARRRAAPRAGAATPRRRANRSAPALALDSFEDLIALAAEKRDIAIKIALERDVRLVRFEDGRLEIALEPSAPKTLINDLSRKLSHWTGRRWMVVVSAEHGRSRRSSRRATTREAELERGVRADPLVQAVLARFPGAEIVGVRGATRTRRRAAGRCRRAGLSADPTTIGTDDDSSERDELDG